MTETESKPDPKAAAKRGFFGALWPDVSTAAAAKQATNTGAFAGAWIAASYTIIAAYAAFTGKVLFSDEVFQDDTEKLIAVAMLAVIAAVAVGLALWLWRRQSIIAAALIFVWVVAEALAKVMVLQGSGIIISVILVFAGASGLRGAIAARKLARAIDIEQF